LNFDDPAVTLALLKANAVVGVTGFFSKDGKTLQSIGIQLRSAIRPWMIPSNQE
jgi:hypothetical protein